MNNAINNVETPKTEIEHKEPINVGFFIPQYAKLRLLELYYNFFFKLCDVNKFEELETDTDSVYLALAESEVEDCIRPEMKAEWERPRLNDCTSSYTADAVTKMDPHGAVIGGKKYDKKETGLFKEECFICT